MLSNSSSETVQIYLQQARTYIAKQQWQDAIVACQNALNLNPNSAEAYQIWGNSLQKLGQSSQAIDCYLRVIMIQPNIPEVYANLGKLYAENKQWSEALQNYAQCLSLSPKFARVYWQMARIWSNLGDTAKSWSYMLQALELDPQLINAQHHLNLANKLWQDQELEKALIFYRYAIQLEPNLTEAYSQIAKILQQSNTTKEEQKSTAAKIKLKKNSANQQLNAWSSENLLTKNKSHAINNLGVDLNNNHQESKPQAEIKTAVSGETYHHLGDTLSKQQNWQGAVQAYQKAIALNPEFSWSYNNLGDVYLRQEEFLAAATAYRQAIALKGDFFWSYQNLGTALSKLEQWQGAIAAYCQAIKLDNSFAWSYYNLGEGLSKLFRWQEAIAAYRQAIKLDPKLAEAHAHLADALIREENWSAGIKYYEQAIELNPGIDVAVYRSLKEALDRRKYLNLSPTDKLEKTPKWPYDVIQVYQPPKTLPDGHPWPKISIVTPSYNQGQFIEETILSVIQQNYPNVEYILVDGGSTDETMAIVNRYQEHFSYVVSEPDQGQSHALNKGFSQATGEILTWLNSDDRLAPGALYAVALGFYTSGADIVAGVCQIFQDDQEIERHLTSCVDGKISLEDILDLENCWLQGKFFYQPEVMFTREIWEKAGGVVNESLYYSMDYEMWARFAANEAKLKVIGYPVAQYRMHENQKTNAITKYRPELLQVRESLQQRFNITADNPSKSSTRERKNLKIVVFNDTGNLGGAGIAHQRIAKTLALAGHQVFPLAGTIDWSLTPVDCTSLEVLTIVDSLKPDLLVLGNIHNLQNSVDILETLTKKYPTLFIMHDQWLFTGRCGYTGNCDRYISLCNDDCPTWDQYPCLAPSKITDAFRRKQAVVQNRDQLLVLGDSQWLTNWGRDVYLSHSDGNGSQSPAACKLQHLYYGLDLQVFKPQDQVDARLQLGLPEASFIILTGSQSLADERKGLRYLLEALEICNLPDVLLLCFGHDHNFETQLQITSVGYLNDPAILAAYYSAADLFVSPALEEAFGQTFIEANACGTAAIGFNLGGVSEAIRDQISGRIVTPTTASALAATILELYRDRSQLELLSSLAPWHVANNFSYYASYHSIMTAWSMSGYLNTLGMSAVTKLSVEQPCLPDYLTIKGGNPQAKLSASHSKLPITITMEKSLQGSGWHPPEIINGVTARWMEKVGTVIINALPDQQPLQLEVKGIMAIDPQLLKTMEIRVNGNLIETTIKHQANGAWVGRGYIPTSILVSQVGLIVSIKVGEAKPLSPQDARQGSLLVESLLIKSS